MPNLHFSSHTLDKNPRADSIRRILRRALQAVDPAEAVKSHLRLDQDGNLVAGTGETAISYPLHAFDHVYLVGAGKAVAPMALAATEILGDQLSAGVLIAKAGHLGDSFQPADFPHLRFYEAGHPVPDERGVHATRKALELLRKAGEHDLVLCLISGGGSALLTHPAQGLELNDLQQLTRRLLESGATINEINCLRKHLDEVKGGGLAQAASPARLITLILSDVIGDPLDVIASGPTVADPTTFSTAWQVLERYRLLDVTPSAIRQRLLAGRAGEIDETPKPGYSLFSRVQNLIIGSNRLAACAAIEQAQREGFSVLLLTTSLQGEASQAGRFLASLAHELARYNAPLPRPACLVLGGETTVTLRGKGLGGRNQEMALGAVSDLDGLENVLLLTLATDGDDGPTGAAGAVVSGETLQRAFAQGLSPHLYLADNDSYHFFAALDDLLKPGPTLTNVNDLAFIFTD
jgi:hydroxypyruvate reductase